MSILNELGKNENHKTSKNLYGLITCKIKLDSDFNKRFSFLKSKLNFSNTEFMKMAAKRLIEDIEKEMKSKKRK